MPNAQRNSGWTLRALRRRHNPFFPKHFFEARNEAQNDEWNDRSIENDRSLPSLRRRHVFECESVLSAVENTRNCGAISNASSHSNETVNKFDDSEINRHF
ncbi:hypothetical protein PUN28_009894 [Cardiocondyla obscurior]|uniref:Uncharacterized protein n=1 Tax=Cardiocondyla obscurior TaxID=286306 RepID=A0AAW2FMA6_9HYME